MIQTQSGHHVGGTDITTRQLDFRGRVKESKKVHTTPTDTITLTDRYTYDHASRLTNVYQTINSESEVLIASYEYNELGQLVRKRLHSTDAGATYLQDMDYAYTIRGWLKSINDPTTLSSTKYFGMELLYNETLASGLSQAPAYNGNISAVKWKNNFTNGAETDTKAYAFTYDKADRLTEAAYGAGTSWAQQAGHYSMSNLTYDGNGNMLSLMRKQPDPATGTSATMDNLTYTYATGNTLTNVEDASANATGFSNGATTATEYSYDAAGNLTEDKNKGISSITYNVLGKADTIRFTDGRRLEYIYDAAGNKLTMKTYDTSATLQSTTHYVNGFVYEAVTTGSPALSFFGAPEGRVVKNGSA